ncbi:hypothetical protein OPV22_002909 [Ensete ventricosum]|uniref:D-isomer specific 2-hydroxyacid dehydrogenase NAD-binding domain-containing protein n=1 Tax=Ensete ventricosum TaxID=4639 RepID=A0AAV8RZ35_ENSVE|nr:hypothetical protein OPV22_002909 [Ensete ventricosum]
MSVLDFDLHDEAKGKSRCSPITFPAATQRMDTLNDLLAASDLVSLHCSLSDDTMQILNAERLQHVKPGAFIVNTAGYALHGAEVPQWMEAWVREMPNVFILHRSADYSEEGWMEIREKAITMLQYFLFEGVVLEIALSDEDDINETRCDDDNQRNRGNPRFHVASQRVPGGGWILETITNVTKRDPSAQFAVAFKSKINRKMEPYLQVIV